MKSLLVVLSLLSFLPLGSAQAPRVEHEQSSFGVEEIPGEPRIKHPTAIPDIVVAALQTDKTVKSCLKDNPLAPGQSLSSWFVASPVQLSESDRVDLVIVPSFDGRESMCFQTPTGIGMFWVFRRLGDGYQLVLKTWAGGLEVLASKTDGYRNIRSGTLGQAGSDLTNTTFHFDGTQYLAGREKTQKQR